MALPLTPEAGQSGAGVVPSANNLVSVDRGALKMALNVLRRAGKDEVAQALEETATDGVPVVDEHEAHRAANRAPDHPLYVPSGVVPSGEVKP